MKKTIKIVAILLAILLTASCEVSQGKLVIIQENTNDQSKAPGDFNINFNNMPQKISIEENAEILKKVDTTVTPLSISPEGIVIGYKLVDSTETDDSNSKIITGNTVQPVNLYAIDTDRNEKHDLGKFLSLKDFHFDETGKLFAFIDGSSNVFIYDLEKNQLQKIIEGKNYYTYDSLSWSKDSKKLIVNNSMTLDVPSKQLISFAVDAYSPFILQKFNNSDIYIVQMKNDEYNDMIALYNFGNRTFRNLANGIFHDSDNVNLIYTKQNQSNLYVLNMETLESKNIESGPIYKAKIMKSTGEILYTTVNYDMTSQSRYLLIKLNPNNGSKKTVALDSPTFYLSPAEDKIFFIDNYNKNRTIVDTAGLNVNSAGNEKDFLDLFHIKATVLKMFQLDYNFTGSYDEYEIQAARIYTNTYSLIPQEALENKLVDFKRFNMPLPAAQKEPMIPSTIILDSISFKDNKASVNIGLSFVNSIELAKENDMWLITGFSTHPDSKEVKEIRAVVQKHINDIKEKNEKEAVKYWLDESNKDFNNKQIQIVQDLMKASDSVNIEIGEIELWNLNEPHRSENPQTATEAKVKIVINNSTSIIKYKLVLSKYPKRSFTVSSWSIDPLSISQLR